MLKEVDAQSFKKFFPTNPHPFISQAFTELNKAKAEKILRLVEDVEKPGIGWVAGVKKEYLISPFSAPFGGFHFRKEIMYSGEIDSFIASIPEFIRSNNLKGVEITLPPDIYHQSFNAKVVNSLIRNNFQQKTPDITNWIDLGKFNGKFSQRNSREYYKQALRNELSFQIVENPEDKKAVYELIRENRAKFGRPIYMTLEDILETSKLWPADFFKVISREGEIVASAIFYPYHPEICYAVFWGDNEQGRPLRAMDFLTFNLWAHYKEKGFRFVDLGISTESGIPNPGLLRFKESHEGISSVKYGFKWEITN